ncbi:hypothetical protein LX59_01214 [Azomonas agilis]|uniref:Flagellar basal body rod FlgEFG protein n=1 Tax=Azomonas agilis TaxID=116849 RepID=A0A562IZ10_9GAMM|nr:hypothetical protein [Azomonas agilis]TWH76291.1 hypothetical protein LX59_01214 [Azomonas agilis]
MELTSVSLMGQGLSAYQSGQRQIDTAGTAIANNSLPSPDNSLVVAERQDITDSLVQLKVGEINAQAGVKVMETADQVLGTLIDVQA